MNFSHYLLTFLFFPAVTVNVLQTSISARESTQSASVCIFLSASNERVLNFTVTPFGDRDATGMKFFIHYNYTSKYGIVMMVRVIPTGGEDFSLDEVAIVIVPPEFSECSEIVVFGYTGR